MHFIVWWWMTFYAAIETSDGENVLNSGFNIEHPGAYNRLNTIVEYQRGALQKVHIAGPISKNIKVMVIKSLFCYDCISLTFFMKSISFSISWLLAYLRTFYLQNTFSSYQSLWVFYCSWLKVLFQADYAILSLQYAIPVDPNRPVQSGDRYIWRHDKDLWSPCSATCGRGKLTFHAAIYLCQSW